MRKPQATGFPSLSGNGGWGMGNGGLASSEVARPGRPRKTTRLQGLQLASHLPMSCAERRDRVSEFADDTSPHAFLFLVKDCVCWWGAGVHRALKLASRLSMSCAERRDRVSEFQANASPHAHLFLVEDFLCWWSAGVHRALELASHLPMSCAERRDRVSEFEADASTHAFLFLVEG
jgi:hypothetical protein